MGRPLDVSASAYGRDSAAILRCHHRIANDDKFPRKSEVIEMLDAILPRLSERVVAMATRETRKKASKKKKRALSAKVVAA